MAVEQDAEKLAQRQIKAISGFFGAQVPKPSERLFVVSETNRKEKLLKTAPLYVPRIQLAEGVTFPGLTHPLDPWLYEQIKLSTESSFTVDKDADWLPGEWILLDITRRPNYNKGRQMYPDTPRFKDLLADLRDKGSNGGILIPDFYKHVPKDSRFAISADEIDGSGNVIAGAVSEKLALQEGEEITTLPYSTFVYAGNLSYPHFGQANTSEWLRNKFGHGYRLHGGGSDRGGLSYVGRWPSDVRFDSLGFRLQARFPSQAA